LTKAKNKLKSKTKQRTTKLQELKNVRVKITKNEQLIQALHMDKQQLADEIKKLTGQKVTQNTNLSTALKCLTENQSNLAVARSNFSNAQNGCFDAIHHLNNAEMHKQGQVNSKNVYTQNLMKNESVFTLLGGEIDYMDQNLSNLKQKHQDVQTLNQQGDAEYNKFIQEEKEINLEKDKLLAEVAGKNNEFMVLQRQRELAEHLEKNKLAAKQCC